VKSSPLAVRIILAILAVVLLGGLIYQFTPALNTLTAGTSSSTPAIKVNGQTVSVQTLDQLRLSNPVYSIASGGLLGSDLRQVVLATAIQQQVLAQDASSIPVSNSTVNQQVSAIRKQDGLTSNKAWTQALQQHGLTDLEFHQLMRENLQIQARANQITKGLKPTTAEAKLFWEINPSQFQKGARIAGREIVLSSRSKAQALRKQLQAGASFSKLADQNGSKDGGALGTPGKGGALPLVSKLALPSAVATQVFALGKPGLSPVIADGGKYYLVDVVRYVGKHAESFASAKTKALAAVKQELQNAALEKWIDRLTQQAKVKTIDPTWKVFNPVVATVNGHKIYYADVLSALYSNQQIASVLQQGGAQAAGFINAFFKPQVLNGLIDQWVAVHQVKAQGLPIVGSRAEVLANLLAYHTRNLKVTPAQERAYYQANLNQYKTAASADLTEATFKTKSAANAFRTAFLKHPSGFTAAAGAVHANVNQLGRVSQGAKTLAASLGSAVFGASAKLTSAGSAELTPVLAQGKQFVILEVKKLKPAGQIPFSQVQSQIAATVLQQQQTKVGQSYIAALAAKAKVVNHLQQVLAEQQKLFAPASTPSAATSTPSAGNQVTIPSSTQLTAPVKPKTPSSAAHGG
jgi:peptidyl-prolyl cis-trans isomerase C